MKHFEDVLISFDQLQFDVQPCGSGMHLFSSTDTMFIFCALFIVTGQFGVVYHAILKTNNGLIQDVAVKSPKGMTIK